MSHGGGALMSCVREGSLEPPYRPPHVDQQRHGEGRTNRFLRGLRRMFKRRGSGTRDDPKSSSTSELLDADRQHRRKEGAYGSGLSVSHDSVFTGERSGDESSDERPTPAHTQLASSHRAELVAAVRRRGRGDGSDDDEDLGLPRSPPASPPTDKADKSTEEVPVKRPPRRRRISANIKRHHAGISSCSDGSLLSVGSSEIDEDSSSGHHHDNSTRSDISDTYNSSEPPSGVAPLSHSAARHKMAVRPRRTHGAPRRKNTPIAASALPITPELNEEMMRSTTPDVVFKSSEVVTESFSSTTTTKHHIKEQQQQLNRELQRVLDSQTPPDTKLKSSSLPPGLALSQLVGQSPAKLSIAESNTPRSSIKRSKSSSQGKSLRDESPKNHASNSETQIYREERISRKDTKYVEESCLVERKSKSEKKMENDGIRAKKEESFFSRLLLRKSGKKSKKDQPDGESQEVKKTKIDKTTAHYTPASDWGGFGERHEPGPKPVPAERNHQNIQKSAGQRAFANQKHKRLDNKGAYVQEGVYKDAYSAAKVSGVEYNITDLKIAEETDKMLNREMKNRFSKRDEFTEKVVERTKRTSSKEAIDEANKRESFNLHGHDRSKRPPSSVQRIVDPFSSKAFINNEIKNSQGECLSPSLVISEEEPPIRAPIMRNNHNDYVFHSGSMPKNIPYFNPNIVVSASASPPKSILHPGSEYIKQFNRSSEHVSEYGRERQMMEKRESQQYRNSKTEETYATSGLRSLGEEYVESRSSVGKSHSFRYATETASISSQESQMPSLPAIVGISEPLLESWEVNYRRNVTESFSERHDYSKRVSARNYNIHTSAEANYDSLPSTDSSYMDSLKTESHAEEKSLFANTIHVNLDSKKRNSDISQIEAKIDDIISSPKPIIAPILKSSSLDSVKSSPEKPVDDRRKTISIESSLSHGGKKDDKNDSETFISVTHINKEQTCTTKTETKTNKSNEKLHKPLASKPGVPEFLNIQLNRVDTKPTTNVVLTANVTPKKLETPQAEKEQEIDNVVTETKISHQLQIKKESITINKYKDNVDDEDKISPIMRRKSTQSITPQSPSTPRAFFKRKATSIDMQDRDDKPRNNSVSTEGSTEKIFDNISIDQKSHSSFGSKSSIQSTDSEPRTPDRHEETVIYRKKPVTLMKERSGRKNEDQEPELMKVFARRSLKLKDSEAEVLAQEIAENQRAKEEAEATKSKLLKNEFNASIKSRDSDKENEDTSKEQTEENRIVDIAARVSQFGQYQRSVSITSVTSNPKRESAPTYKSEVNKYKKEVSDSTPEKRLRNRTFPDPSNDREEIKNIAKHEAMAYKADTLNKRPWQKNEEDRKPFRHISEKVKSESAVIDAGEEEKGGGAVEGEGEKGEGAPQFKGILQMREEWERRAKQGMTK